jgi:hypothetical protein
VGVWMHDDCVCMCGAEVCGGLGMWSCVNGSVDAKGGGSMGMCMCVCRRWWVEVCEVCVLCGVVCVRLSDNRLGAEGGAAMADAVRHLTSLTTLKYV